MSKPAATTKLSSAASLSSATGKSTTQLPNTHRSTTTSTSTSSSSVLGSAAGSKKSTSSPSKKSYDTGDNNFLTSAPSDAQHERIINLLYDNILEPAFQSMLHDFVTKYCRFFADPKAVQPNWPQLFQEYEQMGRDYLEARIQQSQPNFSLRTFSAQLQQQLEAPQSSSSDGGGGGDDALALMEVADILQSFVDYEYFKHHMADHFDSYYSGEQNLSGLVTVTSIKR